MGIKKVGSFRIKQSLRRFKGKKKTLPKQIGSLALNFYLQGFRRGGFTDQTFKKWEPRWKRLSRTRVSRKQKEPANLVKSGDLRRSLKVKRANFNKIVLGTTGVRYAARHNEGITDRLGRKMPRRKFLGRSKTLERKIKRRIKKELDKVFRR